MTRIHFLNVNPGACTIIEHPSGRITVIDICNGRITQQPKKLVSQIMKFQGVDTKGNFGMSKRLTNPINYLKSLGVDNIFRVIVTHPDMDHIDGLSILFEKFKVSNFWCTNIEKMKPEFKNSKYHEEDWDCYHACKEGKAKVKALKPKSGENFKYANIGDDPFFNGDSLYILAPNHELINACDVNDSSFVILLRYKGKKILLPGDAHDICWEFIIKKYSELVKDCDFLLAPHHGRDSNRCYDFLDVVRPKLTLFGCAPSQYLGYDAWKSRGLKYFMTNQIGNLVLEIEEDRVDAFISNESFAAARGNNLNKRNSQGFVFLQEITPKYADYLSQILEEALSKQKKKKLEEPNKSFFKSLL